MKRSELIQKLADFYDTMPAEASSYHIVDILIGKAERMGMPPVPVKSKQLKPKNYPYGAMCTMRCNCEDCNPEFLVCEWESEDEN